MFDLHVQQVVCADGGTLWIARCAEHFPQLVGFGATEQEATTDFLDQADFFIDSQLFH